MDQNLRGHFLPHPVVCRLHLRLCNCLDSLLAHLDDNFIRHFANESTFIIDITATPPHNSAGNTSTAAAADEDEDRDAVFDVTLSEIDVCSNNTPAMH